MRFSYFDYNYALASILDLDFIGMYCTRIDFRGTNVMGLGKHTLVTLAIFILV
jgi:hypothetical protein